MTERTLPTILKVETVAKSRIFEVQAVDLRFSNGEERTFERLTRLFCVDSAYSSK